MKNRIQNKLTIIVNTCDSYADLWPLFFSALNEASGTYPTWNFHKYIIGRDGKFVAEIGPRTKPYNKKMITLIEKELAK